MQTLAQILAGIPGDPTQVNPGLAPLINQAVLGKQLAGPQLQGAPPMPQSPQMPGQPQMPQGGIGNLGATALPLLTGTY